MTSAMLIIDVQTILCTGEHAAFECARVIDRINLVARRARQSDVPVIVIQHETIDGPMDYGSDAWKLAPGLEVFAADTYLRKRATDSFHNTELQQQLESRGVSELVICGLQSEFCVDTTTRRALALGYPVTLVEDGHSTMDNAVLSAAQISAHHNETLSNISSFGSRAIAVPAADIKFDRPGVRITESAKL